MKEEFFNELKKEIQSYFEKGGSHAFDHTQRVFNMAVKLAEAEKADLDIVKASALLHDIARLKEDNNECECHAQEGCKLAKEILEKTGFPKEKIEKVCYAIEVHRHSTGIKPESKEAAIIQDADRLDALGAITIARMFSTGGKLGTPLYNPDIPFGKTYPGYKSDSTIHRFHAKILKITPEMFNTKLAKEIAKDRYKFVEEFLNRFMKEWEGN